MKYKGVYQRNTKDCGVASLLSIIKYYKGCNTYENVRYLTKCTNNGITALNLIEAAKKLGFDSRGLKCEYDDINRLTIPIICHTILENGYNHYVVLHKIEKNYVILFDPARGVKKYTKEEFIKIWDNIVIELKPIRKMDYIKEKNNGYLKKIIKNNKKNYLIIILLSFLSIIFALMSNYYLKMLLDFNNPLSIFVLFLIIIIIKEINDLFRNKVLINIDNNILKDLNLNTHSKLLSLPYYYFNSRTKGDIITKFNDLEYIKNVLVKIPICLFIDSTLLLTTSIILFNINQRLFTIFLIICLFYLSILVISNKKIKNMVETNQELNSLKNTILIENINSIKTIKNMNIKNTRHNIFDKINQTYIDNNIEYENYYNLLNFIKNNILLIGINLVLFCGIKLVNNNVITISNLILFNSLIIYFIEPLKEICDLSLVIKNGINAIKRVSEIYNINYKDGNIYMSDELEIKFNNLSFSYNHYSYVLKNINYDIKSKDKVIVIGKSGSGKSTLFKLLAKIYEVDENMITINDNDINEIEINNIITYVSEEEKLFNDTLYNNITLYNENKYDNNILEITGVNKIMYEKNITLNSIIEEEGSNLSRGEKQKIILARVLLKNSNIIILDESLSGIEKEEEFKIMTDILMKFNEKTIIYISHSEECINLFNKILDLNQIKEEK